MRRISQFTQLLALCAGLLVALSVPVLMRFFRVSDLRPVSPQPLRQVYVMMECTGDIQQAVNSNNLTTFCGVDLAEAWGVGWRDDSALIHQAGWTVIADGKFVLVGDELFQYESVTSASNSITLRTGPATTPGYAAGTVVAPVGGHS